jgi:hypothetical protein
MRNAILYSRIDREDGWVCGGLVFRVLNTETYEDAYNEVKHKIEHPDTIKMLMEGNYLMDDLFEDDDTYKFVRTYWKMGLYFVFQNSEQEEAEYRLTQDFVTILE